jgi:HAMP domain-containing protein
MMTQGKPKRRIRNFLLDKRFQLKYTLAVVAVSAVISAGLGYFLYQAHRESSRVASLDDPDLDGALRSVLLDEDRKVLFALAGFLGGLVLCLGAVGIVATHKIAGPAYAMRRTMSLIADGKYPTVRALRKHDELQAVGNELKRMADNLREREESELKTLKAALEGSAADQLKDLIRQKEERLAS